MWKTKIKKIIGHLLWSSVPVEDILSLQKVFLKIFTNLKTIHRGKINTKDADIQKVYLIPP